MIFITDENIPSQANKMLEAFDRAHQIRPLTDYFPKGTPDIQWIAGLGGWNPKPAVLSGDSRILRNSVEAQVLKEAKLMWAALGRGWINIQWEEFAWKIIKVWPDVRNGIVRAIRPAVFEVRLSTLKVEKRYDL